MNNNNNTTTRILEQLSENQTLINNRMPPATAPLSQGHFLGQAPNGQIPGNMLYDSLNNHTSTISSNTISNSRNVTTIHDIVTDNNITQQEPSSGASLTFYFENTQTAIIPVPVQHVGINDSVEVANLLIDSGINVRSVRGLLATAQASPTGAQSEVVVGSLNRLLTGLDNRGGALRPNFEIPLGYLRPFSQAVSPTIINYQELLSNIPHIAPYMSRIEVIPFILFLLVIPASIINDLNTFISINDPYIHSWIMFLFRPFILTFTEGSLWYRVSQTETIVMFRTVIHLVMTVFGSLITGSMVVRNASQFIANNSFINRVISENVVYTANADLITNTFNRAVEARNYFNSLLSPVRVGFIITSVGILTNFAIQNPRLVGRIMGTLSSLLTFATGAIAAIPVAITNPADGAGLPIPGLPITGAPITGAPITEVVQRIITPFIDVENINYLDGNSLEAFLYFFQKFF